MRLINIKTLQLEQYFDSAVPPSAILSHRWGSEELKLKEMSKRRVDESRQGYKKLVQACEKAASYDVDHLWIDTVCIDKTSSAELSEAISSMFSYYEEAKICLAYLEDVKAGSNVQHDFAESVWFTRSWTLQELLAPWYVDFFDGDWNYIGYKHTNAGLLEQITTIPQPVLKKAKPLTKIVIATKMSGAAHRVATRPEDIAYSLMGIFDVNIPLLYGEGWKAFTWLQEEIIRRTNRDLSFLLHRFHDTGNRLLAGSPAEFVGCRSLSLDSLGVHGETSNIQMAVTNVGLEIQTTIYRWSDGNYGLELAFGSVHAILFFQKGITQRLAFRVGIGLFDMNTRVLQSRYSKRRKFTIHWAWRQDLKACRLGPASVMKTGFAIRIDPPIQFERGELLQESDRSLTSNDFWNGVTESTTSRIVFKPQPERTLHVDLFFDFDFRPCALVSNPDTSACEERDLWDLSDAYPESMAFRSHKAHQVALIGTVCGALLRTSFEYPITYARVPDAIALLDTPIFVSFTLSRSDDLSLFWTFSIGQQLPEIVRGFA